MIDWCLLAVGVLCGALLYLWMSRRVEEPPRVKSPDESLLLLLSRFLGEPVGAQYGTYYATVHLYAGGRVLCSFIGFPTGVAETRKVLEDCQRAIEFYREPKPSIVWC